MSAGTRQLENNRYSLTQDNNEYTDNNNQGHFNKTQLKTTLTTTQVN